LQVVLFFDRKVAARGLILSYLANKNGKIAKKLLRFFRNNQKIMANFARINKM